MNAAVLRERALWLQGVADHLPDRDVADVLVNYALRMTGRDDASAENEPLVVEVAPPSRITVQPYIYIYQRAASR